MNFNLDLTKTSTRWMTDLYLRAKTMKLLEENKKIFITSGQAKCSQVGCRMYGT